MKRILFAALAALAVAWGTFPGASAQVDFDIDFDFDIYPDYYTDYQDDIYRYGFNINNYAYQYEDRFATQVWREYGISPDIRYYLNRGFSPSDILFAAELSYRTGHRFQYILDGYYNSPTRDWITISINLGIPYGSPRFNLILGSFKKEGCPDRECPEETCPDRKCPGRPQSGEASTSPSKMLPLAVATSIDALAVGVNFAFLNVDIVPAVLFIGSVTFLLSFLGVKVGNLFGVKFKSKAEIAGGVILVGLGIKILLENIL